MDQERRRLLLASASALTLPALSACGGGGDDEPGPPYQLKVEKDVQIPMRDGTFVMANIFRPDVAGNFPVIVSMSPYPKDVAFKDWPTSNFSREEIQDPLMHWESPPPTAWVSRGYVQVLCDQRGSGVTPGKLDILGPQIQQDLYDTIEWSGVQAWSNGNVGLIGESYLGAIQWLTAQLNPPHLKAILVAQGFSDVYRDAVRHGGILSARFLDFWFQAAVKDYQYGAAKSPSVTKLTDQQLAANTVFAKDFRLLARETTSAADPLWTARTPDLSKIRAAVFAYANNGGFGLHLKGTIDGFGGCVNAAYRQLHTGVGLDPDALYRVADVEKQQRFFDRFLKGIQPAQPDAQVDVSVRTAAGIVHRTGTTYPLSTTSPQTLNLDAGTGALSATQPASASTTYAANYAAGSAPVQFALPPLTDDLELIGPARLRVWLSSSNSDADLFVALREYRPDGTEVTAAGAQDPTLPISLGWQRASRRNVNPARSTTYSAWHTDDRSEPLTPGTVYAVEINIWPIAWRLAKGNRLVLEIGGSEQRGNVSYAHPPVGLASVGGVPVDNGAAAPGNITLWTGGAYDSILVLPVNASA